MVLDCFTLAQTFSLIQSSSRTYCFKTVDKMMIAVIKHALVSGKHVNVGDERVGTMPRSLFNATELTKCQFHTTGLFQKCILSAHINQVHPSIGQLSEQIRIKERSQLY